MAQNNNHLTETEKKTRKGNARGGRVGLKDDPEARKERARNAGRACLAAYGRGYYRELALKRHGKKNKKKRSVKAD